MNIRHHRVAGGDLISKFDCIGNFGACRCYVEDAAMKPQAPISNKELELASKLRSEYLELASKFRSECVDLLSKLPKGSRQLQSIRARERRRSDEAYRVSEGLRNTEKTKVVNARTIKKAHRRKCAWSEYEDRFLADNFEKMRYVEIAGALSRTYCAVRVRVARLREKGVIAKYDPPST